MLTPTAKPTIFVPFLVAVVAIILLTALALGVAQFKSSFVRSGEHVVATVDGNSITLEQVENAVPLPLYLLETQRHQLLLQAIQQRIDEELLRSKASQKGLTVQELIDQASQLESIARMADFPAPVKPANTVNQSPAFDGQREARIRQALLVSLRRKADIHIMLPALEPPIMPVSSDDDPRLGPDNAPVTIIEFSDFQCPFCQMSVGVLRELRQTYGDKIQLVYRDFPAPNHPDAFPAAEASQCAHEQGKFWEYHDLLFTRQAPNKSWNFLALAAELGLDAQAFSRCLNSGRFEEEIKKDLQDGLRLGVTNTPTFFINGRPLIGLQSVTAFQALIDKALRDQPDSHTPQL